MVPAILTSIRWPIRLAMMLGYSLAFWTVNAIWVELLNQRFEASRIVWILPLKLHERVQAFRSARADWVISINFAHTANHGIWAYFR